MPRGHKKVDKLRALELKKGGATYAEIAKVQGVSPQAVNKQIKDLLPNEDTETFKNHRADILAEMQSKLLSSIEPDEIKKVPVDKRIVSMGILFDKERLERGKSTSNVSILFSLVEEACQQRADGSANVIPETTQT